MCAVILGKRLMTLMPQTSWNLQCNTGTIFKASHEGFSGPLCRNSPATHYLASTNVLSHRRRFHGPLTSVIFLTPKPEPCKQHDKLMAHLGWTLDAWNTFAAAFVHFLGLCLSKIQRLARLDLALRVPLPLSQSRFGLCLMASILVITSCLPTQALDVILGLPIMSSLTSWTFYIYFCPICSFSP